MSYECCKFFPRRQARGIPVVAASQEAGQFIVTFPEAYHAGFNTGFNYAEAVNFAVDDWIPWGLRAVRRYREVSKDPVFSHEHLLCSLISSGLTPELAKWLHPSFATCVMDELRRRDVAEGIETARSQDFLGLPTEEGGTSHTGSGRRIVCLQVGSGVNHALPSSGHGSHASEVETTAPPRARMRAFGSVASDAAATQCISCRTILFFSSVTCGCAPDAPRCLHCLEEGRGKCLCSPSEQTLWYRFSNIELRNLLSMVASAATPTCSSNRTDYLRMVGC